MNTDPTLPALLRATRLAYQQIEHGDDADRVLPLLIGVYELYGLDANTAESSLDWYDMGPALLIESVQDALARRVRA